jgi:acetyl/propionyl-CoA carboxylase alpha subunit
MQRALREYRVEGIQTNLNFFTEVLNDSDFRNGRFDTGYIEKWMRNRVAPTPPTQVERDLAVLSAILADVDRVKSSAEPVEADGTSAASLWKTTGRRQGLRR